MLHILSLYDLCKRCSYSSISPLRYPGGKTRAVKKITKYFPKNLKRLCSPFIGGGSIELYCAAKGIKVIGYDCYEPLVNFWKYFLKNPKQIAQESKRFSPLSRSNFFELQKYLNILPPGLHKAVVFFVLNRCSFSGLVEGCGISKSHTRRLARNIKKIARFHNPNLEVRQSDFRISIPLHKNDFLYLDPPYFLKSKLYGKYGELQENFDHETLAKLLRKRGRWILSYNDCPKIRQLYKGYRMIRPKWKYGMSRNTDSKELLIFSHDIELPEEAEVFDPPYVPSPSSTTSQCKDEEETLLQKCEDIIKKGLAQFTKVGEAIYRIQKEKLYPGEYASFNEYYRDRFGIATKRGELGSL